MYLLNLNWNDLGPPIAVIGGILAIFAWFMSRFLEDKKDKVTHHLEIEQLKLDMKDVKSLCKDLQINDKQLENKFHTIDKRLSKLDKQ